MQKTKQFDVSTILILVSAAFVAGGVPIQFYNITLAHGVANFNDLFYLLVFGSSVLIGLCAFVSTLNIFFEPNIIGWIKLITTNRWHSYLLSRPLIEKRLNALYSLNRQLAQDNKVTLTRLDDALQQLAQLKHQQEQVDIKPKMLISGLSIGTNPGFIYVAQREDGIIKIGRSNDTNRRLHQHEKDYQARFELLWRFAVADTVQFERLALDITRDFEYNEAGRIELRKMTDEELREFVLLFRRCCELVVGC